MRTRRFATTTSFLWTRRWPRWNMMHPPHGSIKMKMTTIWSLPPHLHHLSGIDEDINTIVTSTAPTVTYDGPITRARARQLNYQVLSFLGNDSNVHENMMLPKLDTFVLLTNEGPSLEKDEHWSKNKHGV